MGRADQISGPGHYFLRDLAGESLIVVRGEDDAIRTFYNVCRHRGTRICTNGEGTFAGRIQCPYHAWTYGLDGRLLATSHMADSFCRDDYPLHAVSTAVWDGHIFVNLASQPESLETQIADLATKFRPWRMNELRLVHRVVYDVHANWKLVVLNYNECLHCPVLHPALNRLHHYLSAFDNEPHRSTYVGGSMGFRPGVYDVDRRPAAPRLFARAR